MDASTQALDSVVIELGRASQLGITVTLAVIMFSVALTLKPDQFRFLWREPKRFLTGAAAQLLGLPLVTLGLAALLSPPPSVALGMFVVACCPGGNISNLLTHLARGETALSVSLTATSSVLAALLTPISIVFWAGLYPPTQDLLTSLDFQALPFILQMLLVLAVPLALGMVFAQRFPDIARIIRPWLIGASVSVIALLIIVGVAGNWGLIIDLGGTVSPIVALHNATAFALGAGAAMAMRLPAPAVRAITFETGIQNTGLGLVILLSQFEGLGGAAVVTALWSIWHLIAGSTLALIFRYFTRKKAI